MKTRIESALERAYRRGYRHGENRTAANANVLALATAKEIAAELPTENAAPDLLKVCKAVVTWAEQAGALPRCSPQWPGIEADAKAAIAKAEGA